MQRISRLATRSTHDDIAPIDDELIGAKIADAQANDRRREIHCFHASDGDTLHRMLNAIEPGSYIRPHRHQSPPKPESIIVLSGSLALIKFGDDGAPDWEHSLLLSQETGVVGADIRAEVWHTLVAMQKGTVMFEVKPGPYSPMSDKDFASWAAQDGSDEAVSYLRRLEDGIREHFASDLK
jgi:cupin fold WbuC family metalloprotein